MQFKMPYREQNSNKGTFGKVLAFCGSDNYIGASYLACLSVLKIGAGLCALSTTDKVIDSVSKMLPELVYLKRNQGLSRIKDYSVVLLGCGLGLDKKSVSLAKKVFKNIAVETPIVIDADGLNIIAKKGWKIPQNSIITPHPLEASRLLGCSLEKILNEPENSAKKLTEKYNCVTVLKMHRTIVCPKSYDIYVNEHGNSALAKAGSGDVLAGMIAGLLAQGMTLFEAAKLGVYIHSRCGEKASEALTEYSVLASELVKYLPNVIKELI